MTKATTIQDIYAAINPLPAMLSAKGKAEPTVRFEMEANASVYICMSWKKINTSNNWDRDYKTFIDSTFDEVLAKAHEFISDLPSAEQAVLHDFMGKLGTLIDIGRQSGIAVDFINPLVDSMKRLSENVITYQPKKARRPSRSSRASSGERQDG